VSGRVTSLRHPGPPHPERIARLVGRSLSASGALPAGLTINAAIAAFMQEAGIRGGAAALEGGAFAPFHYVMPALSTDGVHAAWYSAPHAPAGVTRLERANATFGLRDGEPFVHIHGVWRESDGRRTGGHLLPHDCVIAEPIGIAAWGVAEHGIEAIEDAETAFKIFHPARLSTFDVEPGSGPRTALARVRPNADFCGAMVELARRSGFEAAELHGCVGSLIQPLFADGGAVGDIATEVFVTHGRVARDDAGAWRAEIDVTLVDTSGEIHAGRLVPGECPVCITFEVLMSETAESPQRSS
jgi:predicted DNA-binding protein with PD1-like motif